MTAVPKSLPAATRLLERYAELDGHLSKAEECRATRISDINAAADAVVAPLVKERDDIAAALEPWWLDSGPSLAGGKKSMELGGCLIGSRLSRPKLVHGFESDDRATEAVRSTRWAKQATRVKYSLDRTATAKLLQLGGKAAADLSSLGFSIKQEECFFVERPA